MKDKSRKITGGIGEGIAAEYLKSKDFEIIDRNYSIRYGEIDLIARKDKALVFVEVKTFILKGDNSDLMHRPEENVHPGKVKSLARTIKFYLAKNFKEVPEWKFMVVSIWLDDKTKTARIKLIEDVISVEG